jgi:transaldolase
MGLGIKLFQDGANLAQMIQARRVHFVDGFTTNPTLMRKAGIADYKAFAREAIAAIPDLPISFEVFADDFDTMEREAHEIASWGGDTYVKIPISNTKAESAAPLIRKLSSQGFSLNVTAILTLDQVETVIAAATGDARLIVSVFAGRIADTGVDPMPIMQAAAALINTRPNTELLWASPREALNVMQARDCGCHIITVPPDLIAKLPLFGKDLHQYSLQTVKMFYEDAQAAGFKLV